MPYKEPTRSADRASFTARKDRPEDNCKGMTTQATSPPGKNRNGWFSGLARIARYRLQIPIMRSRKTPEHVARGVMVGTVWACTPFFGLHMTGAFLTWLVSRRLFNWDFSLINALAWTWTTNVFTVIPAYYLFFLTGQAMLGRFTTGQEAGEGFDTIASQMLAAEEASFWDAVVIWFESLISNIGLPLAVGWIPWGILCGWLAYRLSHGFVVSHRNHRARRKQKKRERTKAGEQARRMNRS